MALFRNLLPVDFKKPVFFTALTVLASVFFSILIFNFPAEVSLANPSGNTSGWAWSENIGWTGFNCSNNNSCGTVDYGVNVDNATGLFTGYAWSENIGWIDFAPSGPYPSSPSYSARVDNTTNQVNGWARALAYGDGWDGWIKMSGSEYAVRRTGTGGQCALSGYAWGSDVIGWLHFNGSNYGVNISSASIIVPSFTYSPTEPVVNSSVNFTDTTQTGCGASITSWSWSFQDGSPSASSVQNPSVAFTTSGSKTVSLTVTDNYSNRWTITSVGGVGGNGSDGRPPDVNVRGQPRYREF